MEGEAAFSGWEEGLPREEASLRRDRANVKLCSPETALGTAKPGDALLCALKARHQMPPVHRDDAAGHERAGVRRQQQERPVEFARVAEPALRNALDERLAGVAFEEVGVQFGLDVARCQRVHPD